MSYAFHWRKAIAVSFLLHLFILLAAGYLAPGITAALPMPEEIILEMDLMSNPAQTTGNSPSLLEPENPQDAPKPTPMKPVQTENPATEAEAIVTSNDLTMTDTEAPAAATTAAPRHEAGGSSSPEASSAVSGGGSLSGIAAPGILSKIDPIYPSDARQAGLEGTVVLRVQILANGRPGEISVGRSTGHLSLDDAAVAAVAQWQFIPARDRDSGKTVACYTSLPVSFRLKNK